MSRWRRANGEFQLNVHGPTDVGRTKLNKRRGFKALKQMTKMNYLHRHEPQKALETYRELLGYTKVS